MRKLTRLPASQLKPGPNVRSDLGTDEELKSLGHSLVKGQQQPLIVRPDYTTLDGYRRLEALHILGRLDFVLDVIVLDEDEPFDDAARARYQLISAVHRKGLSLFDRCSAVALIPCSSNKQLAEELDLDQGTAVKLRSFENLIEDAKEAVKDGRLSDIVKMYSVAQLPKEEQPALLAKVLNGATREEVASHSKAARNGTHKEDEGDDERLASVSIALPGDVTVTVRRKVKKDKEAEKGDDLTLAMVVQYLLDAHKDASKGKEQGLTAKSFVNVMRDKAKAKAGG